MEESKNTKALKKQRYLKGKTHHEGSVYSTSFSLCRQCSVFCTQQVFFLFKTIFNIN